MLLDNILNRIRREKKRQSVCLVTNELYPFAPGGIGRLMYNWITSNAESGSPVELHLLLPQELLKHRTEIAELCTRFRVQCHFCEDDDLEITRLGSIIAPQRKESWDYAHPYRISYQYFVTLLRLERSGLIFDVVEFPDYGGWGAVAIEAKRATLAFLDTQLCVRLHSTYGVIVSTERFYHHPSGYGGAMVDLEHFALRHADLVIAHQETILKHNQKFYNFDDAWLSKSTIETPPIVLDNFEAHIVELPVKRFVYSSRLQPFKRPDLFIRAACLYYDRYPEDDSEALIVSYGWDKNYISSLVDIVPPRHRDKIKFFFNIQGEERQALLAGAIVVIPSDYESYCLFAFETALLGRRLLLRRDCIAFSSNEGWIDEVNCLHFGSEPDDLAVAMRRAIDWRPSINRVTEPSAPYWGQSVQKSRANDVSHTAVKHHVFVLGAGSIEDASRIVPLCVKGGVCKVVAYSGQCKFAEDMDEFFGHTDVVFEIASSSYNDLFFGAVWRDLQSSDADFVTVFYAVDNIDLLYLGAVERVLSSRPNLGIVTANEAITDGQSGSVKWPRLVTGEHVISGLSGASAVGRLFTIRPSVASEVNYTSSDREYAFHSMFHRAAVLGKIICVLPDVFCVTAQNTRLTKSAPWLSTNYSDTIVGRITYGAGLGLSVTHDGSNVSGSIVRFSADKDTPYQRLSPKSQEPWGDPVSYSPDYSGILVHPVYGSPTVARISLPGAGMSASMLFVDIENAHEDNDGFEAVILPGSINDADALMSNLIKPLPKGSAVVLSPKMKGTILIGIDRSEKHTHFYVVTRMPGSQNPKNCHAIIRSYGIVV